MNFTDFPAAVQSLWRRNLQFRLVTASVAVATILLTVVGAVLVNRVDRGVLAAKERTSLTEATAARDEVQRLLDGSDTGVGAANATRMVDAVITALAVRAGSPGLFDALLLSDPSLVGQPERGTKLVSEASVPAVLRAGVQESKRQAWMYTHIIYEDGTRSPGIVIGAPVTVPRVGQYELYLMFPFTGEQETISLISRAVLITGIALLTLIGVMVWFVVANVTDPVRQAAHVAERLSAGELDRRMEITGEDELARLAMSFNDMATSLQNQIVRLEHLSTVQQQFVSDVSHELRTPLTAVSMATELLYLGRDSMPDRLRSSTELLHSQVARFDAMLRDLLEISRFDAGASELEVHHVDVPALVTGVVAELQHIATENKTELRLADLAHQAFIEGDGRRIARVVRNLVLNAIEHSEGKPVEVRVAASPDAVAIGVRDYGRGIEPDDLERVFSRFWRADTSRTRTLGGTGLGLAISADDAHLHGGLIEVWGQPGKGAHFVVTLPIEHGQPFEHHPIEVTGS